MSAVVGNGVTIIAAVVRDISLYWDQHWDGGKYIHETIASSVTWIYSSTTNQMERQNKHKNYNNLVSWKGYSCRQGWEGWGEWVFTPYFLLHR